VLKNHLKVRCRYRHCFSYSDKHDREDRQLGGLNPKGRVETREVLDHSLYLSSTSQTSTRSGSQKLCQKISNSISGGRRACREWQQQIQDSICAAGCSSGGDERRAWPSRVAGEHGRRRRAPARYVLVSGRSSGGGRIGIDRCARLERARPGSIRVVCVRSLISHEATKPDWALHSDPMLRCSHQSHQSSSISWITRE
jgi:hypothetical protein